VLGKSIRESQKNLKLNLSKTDNSNERALAKVITQESDSDAEKSDETVRTITTD